MPSTYSNRLRLELQADNENQGNWGSITNRNLGILLETAVAGVKTISVPDTDITLSALNGADDEARYALLVFTGTLTATRNVVVPNPSKLYYVKNATNQPLIIKTAMGLGVTVPAGRSTGVFSDGTNVGALLDSLLALDATPIGGTVPSSGAFTTLSASGVATLNGVGNKLTVSGAGSTFTINPATPGALDNVAIGDAIPLSGKFTTLSTLGNVVLGDADTDTVLVNGRMSVGGALSAAAGFVLRSASMTGTDQFGGAFQPTFSSAATNFGTAVYGKPTTAAATFTMANCTGLYAANATKGAGSIITNLFGVYVEDLTQGATNIGAFFGVSSGTGKWNVYASGTAQNYFNAEVLIGKLTTTANGAKLQVSDGITFPATQVSKTDPNTLDDYEQGSFTPVVEGTTTVGTATYTIQVGRYTKIGDMVHFTINLNYSGGTGTGDLRIAGLPFALLNVANTAWVFNIVAQNLTYTGQLGALGQVGATSLALAQQTSNANATLVPYDAAAGTIFISGTYKTAD